MLNFLQMQSNLKPHAMPPLQVCETINESHNPTFSLSPQKAGFFLLRTRGTDSPSFCAVQSHLYKTQACHTGWPTARLSTNSVARMFPTSFRRDPSSREHRTLFCGDSVTDSRVPIGGQSWHIHFIHFGVSIFFCSIVISVT